MKTNEQYGRYLNAVRNADNDPENTMLAQLTQRDLATIALSVFLAACIFSEAREPGEGLMTKLMQVSHGQDFLPWKPEDVAEMFE